jgi:cytosine/adenosine deaminase-related metal-dependent hydrolase
MRAAIFQQRVRNGAAGSLDAKMAFRMATVGGAECLGMAEHLGTLDPGKRADFVVVDLNDPAVQPVYDPIDAMVYSASRHNVRATFIGGQEVKIDPSQFLRDCAATSERLKAAF